MVSCAEDFWLGLKKIHSLTQQGDHILRIEVEDWKEGKHWAEYHVSVEGPSNHYALRVDHFSGDLHDAMTNATGTRFSTKDTNGDQRNSVCTRSSTGKPFFLFVCLFTALISGFVCTTHLPFTPTPVGRRLVVQQLRRDKSERKVFVDEGERTFHEEEGRSLEARHGAVALPENHQDDRAAGHSEPERRLSPSRVETPRRWNERRRTDAAVRAAWPLDFGLPPPPPNKNYTNKTFGFFFFVQLDAQQHTFTSVMGYIERLHTCQSAHLWMHWSLNLVLAGTSSAH